MTMDPSYLTLSHCWGKTKVFKLTSENLADMEIVIPEESLCQTFQDAIFITRSLGYEYLWIDLLCIIQDSIEDWRVESAKMSSVYGGSVLNLAAFGAKDGSEGCFFERDPDILPDIQRYIFLIPHDPKPGRWFNCVDPLIYKSSMQDCPLSSRGWAFQEKFLASRTLHFTKLQLYWECRMNTACETYQDQLPFGANQEIMGKHFQKKEGMTWPEVIGMYSGLQLTFPSDRLVAISGVARWMHDKTGYEYVAGLWKEELHTQLLWHPSIPTRSAGSGPS